MSVAISSTNPVTGNFPDDEPRFSGSLERLRGSLVVADVPEPAVAAQWVTRSVLIGQIIDAVQDASYRVVSVPDAQALAQADQAIQPAFYRIARGADANGRRGDVVVQGLAFSPATTADEGDIPARFASVGLWLNPATGQWVQAFYDVATDTTSARPVAEQYVRVIGDLADNNIIIGAPNDDNAIGGGPGLAGNNLIVGGGNNTIPAGYQNGVFSSTGCTVQGSFNQVYGGDGCVVPGTCQYVTLINCTSSLVIPAGTTHKTYIDDQGVSGGGPTADSVTETMLAPAVRAKLNQTLVEMGIDFPAAGAQSRDIRIKDQRFVGTVSLLSTTSGMTNLSFKKNGVVVALPVAVVIPDVLTVSASMPTGGGVIELNIS